MPKLNYILQTERKLIKTKRRKLKKKTKVIISKFMKATNSGGG